MELVMQKLVAYSFNAETINPTDRLNQIDSMIDSWLEKKGATSTRSANGSFVSKTGDGNGQFTRITISSNLGTLKKIGLIESTHTGAIFITSLILAAAKDRVFVYSDLSATPGESMLAPINISPRCPHIIRNIIDSFQDWKFSGQTLPSSMVFDAKSDEMAELLCDEILSKQRKLPMLVISTDEDEIVWNDLHTLAAEQLTGLAEVSEVGAQSSWVLTDRLGQRNSCYLGAVKLYWPGVPEGKTIPGITWTSTRLKSFGISASGRNKFLNALRREIMSISALTISSPGIFREIKVSAEKERILALEADAREKELETIIEENTSISNKLEEYQRKNEELEWKIRQIRFSQKKSEQDDFDNPEETESSLDEHLPPAEGETRYYKKIGSGGGVDSLVVTSRCQHKESNWKPAFKGDQAEKGLLKLEGRNDWKSIAHCSACTGGGRWKVNW
jgi:hypothetical protein